MPTVPAYRLKRGDLVRVNTADQRVYTVQDVEGAQVLLVFSVIIRHSREWKLPDGTQLQDIASLNPGDRIVNIFTGNEYVIVLAGRIDQYEYNYVVGVHVVILQKGTDACILVT